MSVQYIRRGSGLAPGQTGKPNADPIFVDSRNERLQQGIGASGTSLRNVQAVIATNVTSVGNGADTTEDNLQTAVVNANTLLNVGDAVFIQAWGRTAANGDSKDIKLYFGATVVASVAASTANNKNWYAEAIVVKTAAGAQLAFGFLQVDATAGAIQRSTPAETETAAITVKTTGKENTAATANSILSDLLTIEAS